MQGLFSAPSLSTLPPSLDNDSKPMQKGFSNLSLSTSLSPLGKEFKPSTNILNTDITRTEGPRAEISNSEMDFLLAMAFAESYQAIVPTAWVGSAQCIPSSKFSPWATSSPQPSNSPWNNSSTCTMCSTIVPETAPWPNFIFFPTVPRSSTMPCIPGILSSFSDQGFDDFTSREAKEARALAITKNILIDKVVDGTSSHLASLAVFSLTAEPEPRQKKIVNRTLWKTAFSTALALTQVTEPAKTTLRKYLQTIKDMNSVVRLSRFPLLVAC